MRGADAHFHPIRFQGKSQISWGPFQVSGSEYEEPTFPLYGM